MRDYGGNSILNKSIWIYYAVHALVVMQCPFDSNQFCQSGRTVKVPDVTHCLLRLPVASDRELIVLSMNVFPLGACLVVDCN